MKKCWRIITAGLFLVLTMGFTAHADTYDPFKENAKHTQVFESNAGDIYWEYSPEYTSARSSDPDVVSVLEGSYYGVRIKKSGKATVTVKYVLDGKSKTAKIKYKVKKFKNKFSKFKVGSENLISDIKKGSTCYISPCSGKVKFKVKKGYELQSADVFTSGYLGGESFPLKNGKKAKLKSGYLVYLSLTDSKGNGFDQMIYVK